MANHGVCPGTTTCVPINQNNSCGATCATCGLGESCMNCGGVFACTVLGLCPL
jgi:hypothetical protein